MTRYDKYNTFSTTTKEHKLSTLVKDGLLNQLKQMVAWLAEYHLCFAFDINLTGTYPRLTVAGTHLSDSHGTYSTSLYVHSRSDLRQCFKPWLENWQSNHIEWQHWMTQATQFKAREKHGSFIRNASKWTWKERIKSLFLHSEIFKDSRSWLGCKVTMRQLSASVDVVDLLWGAVSGVSCKDSVRLVSWKSWSRKLCHVSAVDAASQQKFSTQRYRSKRIHWKHAGFWMHHSHREMEDLCRWCGPFSDLWCSKRWVTTYFLHFLSMGKHVLTCFDEFDHVYAYGLVTVAQIHTSASDSLGWGGVGWDDNVIGISTWSWCYALWSSLAFPHDPDAMLHDRHWHFHMILMLRSMIFIGISTWSWCYAPWSSLAFPHDPDATLHDLHWHFHMILMLRSIIFIGISTWSWCYAPWSSLAFPHDPDATLHDLHWHFHMILMLRSMIFNCNCTHPHPIVWGGVGWDDNVIGISTWSWCYAPSSSLAFPHDPDATLHDRHWHFHMILMLRSMIFIGISTWSWCYALWSSLAFPHDLDATLYDLHWHFHMILMLRSMIFIGISTWSWCYALWSSLAFPHDPDATLHDLHWHFHMILMLRSMIFNCNCTHPHPIVWGGVGWDDNVIGISTWSWCYAILKYGNACALSSGGGSAQVKTWWKPPLTRWRKCEKKLRLPFFRLKSWKGCYSQSRWTFFGEVLNEKIRSSLWRNSHFHHFRTPVTLPPGCLCLTFVIVHSWSP